MLKINFNLEALKLYVDKMRLKFINPVTSYLLEYAILKWHVAVVDYT